MYMVIIPFLFLGLVVPGIWVAIGILIDNYFSAKKETPNEMRDLNTPVC